jgi:hypothetical protein
MLAVPAVPAAPFDSLEIFAFRHGHGGLVQNALRADQHGALEVLVNLHLEQHGDDVEKSVCFGIAST